METTEILDTNYNLVDYFFIGGSGPMTVLTIFLIGVLIAAWKAPKWVRDIGFAALIASLCWVLITLADEHRPHGKSRCIRNSRMGRNPLLASTYSVRHVHLPDFNPYQHIPETSNLTS